MAPEEELRAVAERRIGTVLRDKYRVDAILGVGGMAVVYKVTHRNQAEFALKMLHPQLSIRDDVRTRFLREGYAANSVKHPGAVLVVDDDVAEDGAAFLVMELLDGAPVEELWEQCGRRMQIQAAVAIGHQLLDVLAAAHAKNIVHRDIKPANVFVTRDGAVKVLDFGIARLRDTVSATGATQTGMMMGTPGFMPPEQAMGKVNEVDGQADVWAAGATLFTLLSGFLVHEQGDGDTPQQLMIRAATQPPRSLGGTAPGVPPPIVRVVDSALAFDKAGRWPSAGAMRDALRDAHAQVYGAPPSRQTLADLLAGTVASTQRPDSAAPVHGPAAAAIVITPAGAAPTGGSEATRLSASQARMLPRSGTPQPVQMPASVGTQLDDPVSLPRTKTSRLVPVFLGLVLVGGIGAAAAVKLVGGSPAKTATEPTVPIAAAASSLAPSAATPPASVSLAPEVAASVVPPSRPKAPSAPAIAHASPTSVPSAKPVPPPGAPTTKPGCDPPYTLDAEGNKHFKVECY